MEKEPQIAVAWGSPGGATAEISIIVEEITGKRPKPIRLMDLAGPNETVQILLSVEDWVLVGKAVAALYGAEIVKEVAKSSWSAAKPIIKSTKDATISFFERLVKSISQAKHAKAPVILGLNRDLVKGGRRHIGFEVENATPEEIGRIISVLSEYGEIIENKLNEWDNKASAYNHVGYEENSDCSTKLIITDDGIVQLKATLFSEDYKTRENITYIIT